MNIKSFLLMMLMLLVTVGLALSFAFMTGVQAQPEPVRSELPSFRALLEQARDAGYDNPNVVVQIFLRNNDWRPRGQIRFIGEDFVCWAQNGSEHCALFSEIQMVWIYPSLHQ